MVHPGGRPRTAIPEKDELIELGKELVEWASTPPEKGERIRVRFCDWYTEKGFVRKQWDHMCEKPEFQVYHERARSLLSLRYIDGTVNASIAHRYLRIYDLEVRDSEDADMDAEALRKKSIAESVDSTKLEQFAMWMDKFSQAQNQSSNKDLSTNNTDKTS
jgi:hypothetical protein